MLTRRNDEGLLEQLIEDLSQLSSYTIGRNADNSIVVSDGKISGQHARLIQCTPDSFVLEDLSSKNGSFVNGTRITRKVIDRASTVQFAGNIFTVEQLLAMRTPALNEKLPVNPILPLSPPSSKNTLPKALKHELDFTTQFADLKQVHEQYPKLRKDCRNREKMVRTSSIILSSIVGISSVLATGGTALPLLHILSGAGLSMLLPTLCSTLLSTDEKLEIIDKEYRDRYRCPNPTCRDSFGTREWELLVQQKNCRRCQAIWVA